MEVLYVGKAKNLRNRIRSYKSVGKVYGKTKKLIKEAVKLKFQTTETELDALLVEAELIRSHQPRFNVRLKDDKSPLYIYLTNERWPRVKTGRLNELPSNIKKRDLFGPFQSGYRARQLVRMARSIFPFCNATRMQKKKKRACFYFHLGLCPGACVGEISHKEYMEIVSQLKLFLRGKRGEVIKRLSVKMKSESAKHKFEDAAELRDKVALLKKPKLNLGRWEHKLPILTDDVVGERLTSLRAIIKKNSSIPNDFPLNRIEAYDISNTSGKYSTGSMVVFTNGLPDSNEYRQFRIKTIDVPNDPAMMKEVLARRVKRDDWLIPQMIVIDGGKTQLKAALKVVPWTIPVVSVVKNPDRLLIPNTTKTNFNYVKLGGNWAGTKLLIQLRDESHRFAKKYHKKLRQKALILR